MAQSENWNGVTAHRIGQRVAYFRKKAGPRGITAQALADRCAELGHPLDRTVIAKLEKGLRQSLTVADLFVLARALDVPPIALICPVDQEGTVEILPGQKVSTYDAMTWFTGERRFPGESGPADEPDDPAMIRAYRAHGQALADWSKASEQFAWWTGRIAKDGATAKAFADAAYSESAEAEHNLRQARRTLRRAGVRLPALPAELGHLDTDKGAGA